MIDILIIIFLLLFAAICSGLNISLMSLDVNDLRRKAKLGNRNAQAVLPLRQKTHLTLASLLLVNVAVASATPLMLDRHFSGILAGVVSTLLLVVFGEITPQALFAKNALHLTARFAPLLRIMTVVTYPISKPLEILLGKIVGHSPKRLRNRHELGLMISEYLGPDSSELDEDEVEIIRGALQLSEKQVSRITTPIKSTFWLPHSAILTPELLQEIKSKGYSHVPVFDKKLQTSYGVLHIKDLVAINLKEPRPVSTLTLYDAEPVGSRTALDTMFRKFISSRSHLIPVERHGTIIGIATIEDLIEEILGHEIKDETDRKKHRQ